MGDYIAYERGMKDGDMPPDHHRDERGWLRCLDARATTNSTTGSTS